MQFEIEKTFTIYIYINSVDWNGDGDSIPIKIVNKNSVMYV